MSISPLTRVFILLPLIGLVALAVWQLQGHTIQTRGVVLPLSEWVLYATDDAVTEHHQRGGHVVSSRSWNSRDERVRIDVRNLSPGDTVLAGSPVAHVVFPLGIQAEAAAQAQLEGGRARLSLLEAGPRPQAVLAARARATGAAREAERLEAEAARADLLVAKNLMSREEVERIVSAAIVARHEADALKAELYLLLAGPRSQELDALRAEVAALEAVVVEAHVRAETVTLHSPMNAVIADPIPGSLLTLQQIDTVLVSIPVDQRVWNRIAPGARIRVKSHDGEETVGHVVYTAQSAGVVGNSVAVATYGAVPNASGRLRPGMTVRATIETGGSS